MIRRFLILLIKIYKFTLSPLKGNTCRYHPDCSTYAVEALEKHGVVKGFWLSVKRVSSCHPFSRGGYDPVP